MISISDSYHDAVLLPEVIQALAIHPDGVYVDFTAGGGSHSLAILKALSEHGRLIAGDRDMDAVAATTKRLETADSVAGWQVCHKPFTKLAAELIDEGIKANGILVDLGVSSHQIDRPERGYSYHADGPLDMRMDLNQSQTAALIVNQESAEKLTSLFFRFGEERYAKRIAAAIVKRRTIKPFERTIDLADVVARAMPASSRRESQHPARRVFQALRIEVNGELTELETLLSRIPDLMADGGRVLFISFHSLEDRLVKQKMISWQSPCACPRHLPCTCGKKPRGRVISKGGIVAGDMERQRNKRARSARLRVFEMRKEH